LLFILFDAREKGRRAGPECIASDWTGLEWIWDRRLGWQAQH